MLLLVSISIPKPRRPRQLAWVDPAPGLTPVTSRPHKTGGCSVRQRPGCRVTSLMKPPLFFSLAGFEALQPGWSDERQ